MSLIELLSIASLAAAAFAFASYILINNLLMQWNDEI
jgi:hypothetical protein